jgi:hypothetical protein
MALKSFWPVGVPVLGRFYVSLDMNATPVRAVIGGSHGSPVRRLLLI